MSDTPRTDALYARWCSDKVDTPDWIELCGTLERELAEARKDAERIDWLEQFHDKFANIDRITSVGPRNFNGLASLRDAIDAALEASK